MGKLGERSVPIMGLDQRIDNAAIGLKSSEGGFLVITYEAGVPNHIGGQDSGKPTLNAFLGHNDRPLPGA